MKKLPQNFFAYATIRLVLFLLACQLFPILPASAGCGCDKPPPAPGAVIPDMAFPGMILRLFDARFQAGDLWTIALQNESGEATLSGLVELRRDLTDPSGRTLTPQILLSLPQIPAGPTSIQVSRGQNSFTVPAESFTVIGKPVMVSRRDDEITLRAYPTAVGADGTLYISVGGLASVCRPIKFEAELESLPLRFTYGDIVILNAQGFLIESLTLASAGHVSFEPAPPGWKESDQLHYRRHSFEQYCLDHQPGGRKEIDPQDSNWHLDGTPHVDYATLIFAINGHFADGSSLGPGSLAINLTMEHEMADATGTASEDAEEETVREEP